MSDLSEDQWQAICQRYERGERPAELSVAFDATRDQIRWGLRKRGVTMRPPHRSNLYHFNEHVLDVVDTEEKAYFLGFLYADGNHYEKHRKISIQLQGQDRHILERFTVLLESTYPIETYVRPTPKRRELKEYCTFTAVSGHFAQRCHELGIVPRKSRVLTFPSEQQVPRHLQPAFMRGYFDGDGCITFSVEKRYTMARAISSEAFCSGMQRTVESHLGRPCGCQVANAASFGMAYYSVGGIDQMVAFLSLLYEGSTIHLNRKHALYVAFLTAQQELKRKCDARSRFFGVHITKSGRVTAHAWVDGRNRHLGSFNTEEAAARAYDVYCREHSHNLGRINFPDDPVERSRFLAEAERRVQMTDETRANISKAAKRRHALRLAAAVA